VGSHPLQPAPFSPYASSGGSFRLRFPPDIHAYSQLQFMADNRWIQIN
jgi:hypothetical protein